MHIAEGFTSLVNEAISMNGGGPIPANTWSKRIQNPQRLYAEHLRILVVKI